MNIARLLEIYRSALWELKSITSQGGSRMRVGKISTLAVAVLMLGPHAALGQASGNLRPRTILSSGTASALAQGLPAVGGEILREIDDPHNGNRWLLVTDPSHPGGPALLLLATRGATNPPAAALGVPPRTASSAPVIRPGDRVIVEESSTLVEARLEAVAMGPAPAGGAFNVRLLLGGAVIRAIAIASGRAAFQEEKRP